MAYDVHCATCGFSAELIPLKKGHRLEHVEVIEMTRSCPVLRGEEMGESKGTALATVPYCSNLAAAIKAASA